MEREMIVKLVAGRSMKSRKSGDAVSWVSGGGYGKRLECSGETFGL
jgi:hypothetical protein